MSWGWVWEHLYWQVTIRELDGWYGTRNPICLYLFASMSCLESNRGYMKVTVDISCCKECPHYFEEVFDDVGFGHNRYRCKKNLAYEISNQFLIPDWCPILTEQKGET